MRRISEWPRGRKAPSLLSGNAIECCCCALMSRRVSRRKSTGRHNLNSPPSAGFLRLRNGRQRCTPNTGATTCMKTKQQWSRWVSVPAGQLLWADLERMGGYGHPVLCCFADWASAAEVLAPGAGMVDRTGCAMNPGTKIVGGVAALVASGALALVSPQLQDFLGRWGAAERSLRRQACRRPANRLQGHHEAYKPGSCGCWRLLVAGTLCRG